MVGDYSDWWLVNSTFVRVETKDNSFVDHTSGKEEGEYKRNATSKKKDTYFVYKRVFHIV